MIATPQVAADAADVLRGVGSALLRAAVVAAIAVFVGERLAAAFRQLRAGRSRRFWVGLAALPFVMPALVQGYAYSQLSLSMMRWPALLEGWYTLLLVVRLVPVATLVLHLAPPPPLSPSAMFCARLLARSGRVPPGRGLRAFLLGPWRNRLVAGAAVFVAAFAEFEVAALTSASSWTVALFRAHAGGLALGTSVLLVLPAALMQLVAVVVGLVAVRSWQGSAARVVRRVRSGGWRAACAYLVVAAALGTVLPAALVAAEGGAVPDLPWAQLAREIGWSLWFAVPAAACAWWLASVVLRRPRHRWPWCVPGLGGALVLGILVLGLFQSPGASRLHDTPVPLLLALTLLLLPTAVLLRAAIAARHGEALHLVTLLAERGSARQRRAAVQLHWQLRGRPQALLWGVLLFGGLFEVVAAALLHPVTTTPAAVRLYNLMHYGHGAVLSGMVAAMVLAGVALLALVVWAPGVVWSVAVARGGPSRG